MGWLRTLFLGDIGNRLDIADAERHIGDLRIRQSRQRRADAGQQRRTDAGQDRRIETLERKVETLELGIAALSRLLVARAVLREEDLGRLADRADEEGQGPAS